MRQYAEKRVAEFSIIQKKIATYRCCSINTHVLITDYGTTFKKKIAIEDIRIQVFDSFDQLKGTYLRTTFKRK